MTFQRARSADHREERRRAILEAAAAMLTEMPVAEISLNELSRRVGLAKSNVVRHIESREAILLALLDTELRSWIDALRPALIPSDDLASERVAFVASTLATSLAERPVLCDLISAQAAVLERNISTEVAIQHKRTTAESAQLLVDLISGVLPELNPGDAYEVVVITLLMASAAWPHSQPTEALRAAYAADPSLAAHQEDFTKVIKNVVGLSITGLLVRNFAL